MTDRMLRWLTDYDFTDYFNAAGGVRALLTTGRKQNLTQGTGCTWMPQEAYSVWDIDLSLRIRMQYGIEDLDQIAY